MTVSPTEELRLHERLPLEPMYTSVTVQRIDGMVLKSIEGHAYDISESGARIELDEPLYQSERIAVCLRLPGNSTSVFASGRVVRVHDEEDDPGARRVAVQFSRFLSAEDLARLRRYIGGNHTQRAAA